MAWIEKCKFERINKYLVNHRFTISKVHITVRQRKISNAKAVKDFPKKYVEKLIISKTHIIFINYRLIFTLLTPDCLQYVILLNSSSKSS